MRTPDINVNVNQFLTSRNLQLNSEDAFIVNPITNGAGENLKKSSQKRKLFKKLRRIIKYTILRQRINYKEIRSKSFVYT